MDAVCNDILTDANKLRQNNIQKKTIKENINQILKKLQEELSISFRDGSFSITTSIPTIFDIPNMPNKVSQRIIWYQIIKKLEEKNYIVYINPSADSCKIQITWLTQEDKDDINNQNKVLAKHTKKF